MLFVNDFVSSLYEENNEVEEDVIEIPEEIIPEEQDSEEKVVENTMAEIQASEN